MKGRALFGQSTAQGLLLLQKSNGIIREALFCMNMLNKNNFVVNREFIVNIHAD
jgi:hypothetical protein